MSKSEVCESSLVCSMLEKSSSSLVSSIVLSLKMGHDSLCMLIEVSPKWSELQETQHLNQLIDSRVVIGVRSKSSPWMPMP